MKKLNMKMLKKTHEEMELRDKLMLVQKILKFTHKFFILCIFMKFLKNPYMHEFQKNFL